MTRKTQPLDFDEVRRIALLGVVSDDRIASLVVLKGGNALRIAHGLEARSSLDLDFSVAEDIGAIDVFGQALFRGIRDRFDIRGYSVFDESIEQRPEVPSPDTPAWWGGYDIRFKVIDHATRRIIGDDLPRLRRTAGRPLSIDISKHEFVEDTSLVSIDGFQIRTYSKRLIVAEKLRALCQQRPDVYPSKRRTGRARDFFDIHQVLTSEPRAEVLGPDFVKVLARVFEAKRVPLATLAALHEDRAFHEADWRSVRDSVRDRAGLLAFEVYFEFVMQLIRDVHTPAGA